MHNTTLWLPRCAVTYVVCSVHACQPTELPFRSFLYLSILRHYCPTERRAGCFPLEVYKLSEGSTRHCFEHCQSIWLGVQEFNQVFKPYGCELHPMNARHFAQCLQGRRIIMIGDSTMRQMFQSLACLLGDHIQDGFMQVSSCLCFFVSPSRTT